MSENRPAAESGFSTSRNQRTWLAVLAVLAGHLSVALVPLPAQAASLPCDSGDASLVGHWTLDEGTGSTASDSSGLGNTGTLLNAAGWGAGASGGAGDFALALDGFNDHVNTGSDSSLDSLSALTYSAWVFPTATGDREIFSKANSTHELRLKANGTLRGCISASGGGACTNSVPGAVPLDTWTHVAMTYDHAGDRRVHLYLDGSEVSYSAQSTASGTLASDASSPQLLGRRGNGTRAFAGSLDEMRIYDTVLESCRIEQLAGLFVLGCEADADCDDSLFCNGVETCVAEICESGTPPACEDGAFCNGVGTCNEGTDSCDAGTPPACEDGAFCNGVGTCNEGTDSCDAGAPPCDPGTLTCNEGADLCEPIGSCTTDSGCDDGSFCNGAETCVAGSCEAGTAPACDDGAFCNGVEICNEVTDSCDAGAPPACGGSNLCDGAGTCNETTDSCDPGTPVTCGPDEVCEPTSGLCGLACPVSDAFLVGHWTLDEGSGSTAIDSSGFGNTGTLRNAAGWSAGASDGTGDFALDLDGVDDYVDTGSDGSLASLSALTYIAWVFPTATGDREIFSKANSTHELRLRGNGALRGCISASGGGACTTSVSGAVPLDAWTHVAMTYDHAGDRRVHLYVDGIEVWYAAQSTASGTLTGDASSPQLLGRRENGTRAFAGSLDEMRIYDTVLEVCRIEQLAGSEPPVLDPIGDRDVAEETELTFVATASDPQSPPQILTFSLSGAPPAGASIAPASGVFTWTPTAAQGPADYTFDVVVSDDDTPSREDRETITVVVLDPSQNRPVLDPIGDRSVFEENELTFTVTASDPESPPQMLTFSLSGALPAGPSIDPVTGVFTWTPTGAQGPADFTFDVVVTDDGVPNLEDRETINVMVAGESPSNGWPTDSPEGQGMDSAVLEEAVTFAQSSSESGSGLIVRNGKSVRAWGSQTQLYDLKSTTKSIGSILLGRALLANLVSLDDRARAHLSDVGRPPSNPSEWLDDLLLWHLAVHAGGFEKTAGYGAMLAPPGTEWRYSDGGANWLADLLTVVYGQDLQEVLQDQVLDLMGITYFGDPDEDWLWRDNAFRSDTINGIKRREFGSGISANVDSLARIAYLFLSDGLWDGQQILPTGFAALVSAPYPPAIGLPSGSPCRSGDGSSYGMLWWNNADGGMPGVPTDAYFSSGLYDSHIVVIPSLQIIATRAAGIDGSWGTESSCNPDWREGLTDFLEPIVRSVMDPPGP